MPENAAIGARTVTTKNAAEQFALANAFAVTAAVDPPHFLASSPIPGDAAIPVNAPLMMDFSKPVNASTLAAGIQVQFAAGAVAGSFNLSADGRRVIFVPAVPWAPMSVHTVVLSSNVTDSTGSPLDNPTTFTF